MPRPPLRAASHRATTPAVWSLLAMGLWMVIALLLLIPASSAASDEVPPELEPWIPWVLADHPEAGCTPSPSVQPCVWSGVAAIDVDDSGGSFRMRLFVERPSAVPLPGGEGQWPIEVRSDTGAATVRDVQGRPHLFLGAGGHIVSGRFVWRTMPQSLALPAETGAVTLRVRGAAVHRPRVDAQGLLHLDASPSTDSADGDALELDVTRHVVDGVPVRIQTRVALRVAGGAREVSLGPILLEGTRPVQIDAELPVRIDDGQSEVSIQVRPGAWVVTIDAIHEGPVTALTAPIATLDAWPTSEFWTIAADDAVRSISVQGGAGIDPARTPIPPEHHVHPAYIVQPGDALTFDEMRRGVPTPPPNAVDVHRTLWIDADGGGVTVKDRLTGELQRDWRLDVAPPMALGHVAVDGTDQVITTQAERSGVEVRTQSLSVVAESRLPSPFEALPAVGWWLDARSLSAQLHVPPGWTLLAVTGVDDTSGTALSGWDLVDVFFVIVAAAIFARVFGLRTGLLGAVALVLSRLDSGAPTLLWLLVAGAVALQRWQAAQPEAPAWRRLGTALVRYGLLAVLLLQLTDFAARQLDRDLFPVFGPEAGTPAFGAIPTGTSEVMEAEQATGRMLRGSRDQSIAQSDGFFRSDKAGGKGGLTKNTYQTLQQDPTAVVQTGPGVPTWTGSSVRLSWSGRVAPEHTIRLWVLPPIVTRLLVLFKLVLLVLLAGRMADASALWKRWGRRWWQHGIPLAAVLLAAAVGAPSAVHAAPSPALLSELEARLTEGPECGAACVSTSRAWVRVEDSAEGSLPRVVVRAEVHAVEDHAWAIPGPASSWRPQSVRVDGAEAYALRRGPDGFLYVRVPAGVHSIQLEGQLTDRDGLTLQFVEAPHLVRFDGPGFRLGGQRRDGTVDDTLQIARVQQEAGVSASRGSDNLSPWVSVQRNLDLGVPWRVTTVVQRSGPLGAPLTLEVPLLAGEAVTDAGLEVRDGHALVVFDGSEQVVQWSGTLAESATLSLEAPEQVPWTEEWVLACSPIFACTPTTSAGLAPIGHVVDGMWQPTWRPWPGESLELAIARPQSVAGQTVTIDRAELRHVPRGRESESRLTLTVRTSQGGPHRITLPADAELLGVELDGRSVPARSDAGAVDLPLQPGSHNVVVRWTEPRAISVLVRAPAVDLGVPSVNTRVVIALDESGSGWRWLLGTWGPAYGPKVLHLLWVGLLLCLAAVLGRLFPPSTTRAPLSTSTWALLLIGMSALPVEAVFIVVAWTVALVVRSRRQPTHWWAYNLVQLALLFGLPVVGICLIWAVVGGLEGEPSLVVAGGGTAPRMHLTWALDRATAALPRPAVVSLPSWAWRALVLAWSLWLVTALAQRAGWVWTAMSTGGWLQAPPPSGPSGSPPPAGDGSPRTPAPDATPDRPAAPFETVAPSARPSPGPTAPGLRPEPSPSRAPVSELHPPRQVEPRPPEADAHAADTEDSLHDQTVLAHRPPMLGPGTDADPETDEFIMDPDSWAPDEASLHGGLRGTEVADPAFASHAVVARTDRGPHRVPPAVELPYDPERHVEIEPPTDEDAVFIPAIDADPADYAAAAAPPSQRPPPEDA